MRFLLPKQSIFFTHFAGIGDDLIKMSELLNEFAGAFTDFEAFSRRAEEIEHRADTKTHAIIEQLNKSFVTPFDREDVYLLAHELDDIIDRIENVITEVFWYGFENPIPSLAEFAKLILEGAQQTNDMLTELAHLKPTARLHAAKLRVHELEDQADRLFYHEIHSLFTGQQDPVLIIKTKDILEELEQVTDKCQEVSNLIEGIVIKSS